MSYQNIECKLNTIFLLWQYFFFSHSIPSSNLSARTNLKCLNLKDLFVKKYILSVTEKFTNKRFRMYTNSQTSRPDVI